VGKKDKAKPSKSVDISVKHDDQNRGALPDGGSLPVNSVEKEKLGVAKTEAIELIQKKPESFKGLGEELRSDKEVALVFAPAGTPAAVISRLHAETVRALNRPETKTLFLNAGVETVGGSPGELAATIKAEILKRGKVIREAGIRNG